jgi:hypothetical protein
MQNHSMEFQQRPRALVEQRPMPPTLMSWMQNFSIGGYYLR